MATFIASELTQYGGNPQNNPLLCDYEHFAYHTLSHDHLVPAAQWIKQYVTRSLTEIENEKSPPTWRNTLGRIEDMNAVIGKIVVPVVNIIHLNKPEEFLKPYEDFNKILVDTSLKMGQSKVLYQKLKTLTESKEYENFSSAQKRAIKQFIFSQDLSGIHLEGEAQKSFIEISRELSLLGIHFSNHVTEGTKHFSHPIHQKDELKGLPQKTLALLSSNYTLKTKESSTPDHGPWMVTLDPNVMMDILKYSQNSSLREMIYKASHHKTYKGSFDNTDHLIKILKLRQQLAGHLGFNNYADMVLCNRMANDTEKVSRMHEQFLAAARPGLLKEHEILTKLKQKTTQDPHATLQPWDVSFYCDQYVRATFNFDPSQVANYLPLDRVLQGMFDFILDIFGVRFKGLDLASSPDDPHAPKLAWHKDVTAYEVIDEDTQTKIATLFCDFYSRPGSKNPGAWMRGETIRRRNSLGKIELPVAHIACNFAPPTAEKPCLLEFSDLTTLFHEFGHALQHMLTQVEVAAVSGTNVVEWDVVELPSQFMENWCYQKDILDRFAFHYQTNEPIPDDLFNRIIGSKNFGNAHHYSRQVALGMIDMKLHTDYDPTTDPYQAYQKILTDIYPFKQIDDYQDKMLSFFNHIFAGGYSAGYYSYLWARIYSADAFEHFEKAGVTCSQSRKELGSQFKNTILALGGSQKPQEIYAKFAGTTEASPAALIRHEGLDG